MIHNKSRGKPKEKLDKIKPGVNLSLRIAKRLPNLHTSNQLQSLTGREVILYVDKNFELDLFSLLQEEKIKKKFRMVAEFAMSDRYSDDLYGHERNSEKSKDVCAIKICVLGNHRIYCKEFFASGIKRIVLIKHVNKKSNSFNKELRKLVDRIGEYSYEFQG
ncbi:MAG: hypothetical protein PHH43_00045 [Candidatus Cloacimonetes bacterium]|jgi:hypothetical protein|nr:hypothetical protein [Candidatus Cloacimonadota bacterium]MDD3234700.1 hypothetical protein [Candidatus Cloacimonadota bacterium]